MRQFLYGLISLHNLDRRVLPPCQFGFADPRRFKDSLGRFCPRTCTCNQSRFAGRAPFIRALFDKRAAKECGRIFFPSFALDRLARCSADSLRPASGCGLSLVSILLQTSYCSSKWIQTPVFTADPATVITCTARPFDAVAGIINSPPGGANH